MLSRFTGTADREAASVADVALTRLGNPEEIAQAVAFFASGKAPSLPVRSSPVDEGKMT